MIEDRRKKAIREFETYLRHTVKYDVEPWRWNEVQGIEIFEIIRDKLFEIFHKSGVAVWEEEINNANQ